MEGVGYGAQEAYKKAAFPRVVESAIDENSGPEALYAALDLGTNSCRMLIAQPKGAQFHVIDSFAKSVQLGSGLEKTGRLSGLYQSYYSSPSSL